jgi:hypothetical protein
LVELIANCDDVIQLLHFVVDLAKNPYFTQHPSSRYALDIQHLELVLISITKKLSKLHFDLFLLYFQHIVITSLITSKHEPLDRLI